MMNRRILVLGGVIAPLLFVFMTILGSALRPGYSHLSETISELMSPGSPNRLLLSALFALYAVLMILFGVGVWEFVRQMNQSRRLGSAAALLMIASGIATLFTATLFPQDPWGMPFTFPGRMHLILSGVSGLLSLLAIFLLGLWFRRTGISSGLSLFSFIIAGAAAASAFLFLASVDGPYMGLAERTAAATGLIWTFTLALWLLFRKESPAGIAVTRFA